MVAAKRWGGAAPLAFALALLGSAGACSTDTPSGHAADASADADPIQAARRAACDDFANRFCEALAKCAPTDFAGTFANVDTCKARKSDHLFGVAFATGSFLESASDPGRCLGAYDFSDCAHLLRAITGSAGIPSACPASGASDGTPCYYAETCGGQACFNGTPMACGVCGHRAAEGASCKSLGDCQAGLFCDVTCKRRGEVGAACAKSSQCQGDLACVQGSCSARLVAGASCAGDDVDPCSIEPATACNTMTGKCVPVGLSSIGTACGLVDADHFGFCPFDAFCAGATLSSPGTCVKRASDGDPCTTIDDCLAPAVCFKGICRIVTGDACAYPAP